MCEDASDMRRQPLLAGHSESAVDRCVLVGGSTNAVDRGVDESGVCVVHRATRARWWVLAQYSLLTFNQV
jgi:hypothetical protein